MRCYLLTIAGTGTRSMMEVLTREFDTFLQMHIAGDNQDEVLDALDQAKEYAAPVVFTWRDLGKIRETWVSHKYDLNYLDRAVDGLMYAQLYAEHIGISGQCFMFPIGCDVECRTQIRALGAFLGVEFYAVKLDPWPNVH